MVQLKICFAFADMVTKSRDSSVTKPESEPHRKLTLVGTGSKSRGSSYSTGDQY